MIQKISRFNNIPLYSSISFTSRKKTDEEIMQDPHVEPLTIIRNYKMLFEYEEKFNNFLNSKKDELCKHLDSKYYANGTYKEIADMFDTSSCNHNSTGTFYYKTFKGNVGNISKNGFNLKDITSMKYGPGIRLYANKENLPDLRGLVLKFKYSGKTAKNKNIEKFEILNRRMAYEIRKYLSLSYDYNLKFICEQHAMQNFSLEYLKNIIVDKLGIDGILTDDNSKDIFIYNFNKIKRDTSK